MLHPDSRTYSWWLLVCICVIFANVWSVPFRLSVGYNRIKGDFTGFTATDILFDLIYFCNIALKTRIVRTHICTTTLHARTHARSHPRSHALTLASALALGRIRV